MVRYSTKGSRASKEIEPSSETERVVDFERNPLIETDKWLKHPPIILVIEVLKGD